MKLFERKILSRVGPGILVAATGVGAGDLITATLAGHDLGLVVLWAAPVGACLKWVLNEGLARWQLATGTTLFEGWKSKLGPWVDYFFLPYLLIWSLAVGAALINACGVAGTAILPLGPYSKQIWGCIHSLLGLVLVSLGGYGVFEKFMSACIGVMFVTTLGAAALSFPSVTDLLAGFVPHIQSGGLPLTLGVLGGVGGTVTLLSYGYWIQEQGRQGLPGLKECRLDLTIGYTLTAGFGMAMVIIGSRIQLDRHGEGIAVAVAEQLQLLAGPIGYWLFLTGFWAAVFSSLLGVWQGVPYLFADFIRVRRGLPVPEGGLARSRAYRLYQLMLALIPMALLKVHLKPVQIAYAVLGAVFMPFLALTLLILNGNPAWVQDEFKNSVTVKVMLTATLLFFAFVGVYRFL